MNICMTHLTTHFNYLSYKYSFALQKIRISSKIWKLIEKYENHLNWSAFPTKILNLPPEVLYSHRMLLNNRLQRWQHFSDHATVYRASRKQNTDIDMTVVVLQCLTAHLVLVAIHFDTNNVSIDRTSDTINSVGVCLPLPLYFILHFAGIRYVSVSFKVNKCDHSNTTLYCATTTRNAFCCCCIEI